MYSCLSVCLIIYLAKSFFFSSLGVCLTNCLAIYSSSFLTRKLSDCLSCYLFIHLHFKDFPSCFSPVQHSSVHWIISYQQLLMYNFSHQHSALWPSIASPVKSEPMSNAWRISLKSQHWWEIMDGNTSSHKTAFSNSAKLGATKSAPLTFVLVLHCLTLHLFN